MHHCARGLARCSVEADLTMMMMVMMMMVMMVVMVMVMVIMVIMVLLMMRRSSTVSGNTLL